MNRTSHRPVSHNGESLLLLLLSMMFVHTGSLSAQEPPNAANRDSLISAAREIMSLQTYCGLVTVDFTGRPHARTMNPFPPEDDMTVWMATSTDSRKAREIAHDPRVCLYYADHGTAVGNVNIVGNAFLVQDPSEIRKRERGYWQQAFPDRSKLVLIKVVPEKIEVLNYKRGFHNDPGHSKCRPWSFRIRSKFQVQSSKKESGRYGSHRLTAQIFYRSQLRSSCSRVFVGHRCFGEETLREGSNFRSVENRFQPRRRGGSPAKRDPAIGFFRLLKASARERNSFFPCFLPEGFLK